MKDLKLLLLPLLIVCFLKAQSKPTLVDTGKVWVYLTKVNTIDHPEVTGNIKQTTFCKFTTDTTISGKTYKKLMESIDSTKSWTCSKYMREDIVNKNVFCLFKDSSSEKLIYTFNLKSNDSTSIGYTVIDTVTINGMDEKRYTLYYDKLS